MQIISMKFLNLNIPKIPSQINVRFNFSKKQLHKMWLHPLQRLRSSNADSDFSYPQLNFTNFDQFFLGSKKIETYEINVIYKISLCPINEKAL